MTPREIGMLYDESMALAILAKLKRQTRRPIRPLASVGLPDGDWFDKHAEWSTPRLQMDANGYGGLVAETQGGSTYTCPLPRCPYGAPGDVLVQLSSWATDKRFDSWKPTEIAAQCNGGPHEMGRPLFWSRWDGTPKPDWCGKLRPGRFMPLSLRYLMPRARVTEVRVERVQSISEADAIAEGLARITKDGTTWKFGIPDRDRMPGTDDLGWPWNEWCTDPRAAYRHLWELTYGPESWDRNDWVWVVSFAQIARNA